MKKHKTLIYSSIAVIVFAVLLLLAGLYDLDVSKYLVHIEPGRYYSANNFAIAIEMFGEIPLYLFLCYAFSVVFWNAYYFGRNAVKIPVCIVSAIALAVASLYIPHKIHEYFLDIKGGNQGNIYIIFRVAVAVCILAVALVGVRFMDKSSVRKQLSFAVVIIFVALCSQLITQGIKTVNHRVRFRAMVCGGDSDFSHFTPWYIFNGRPEEFDNFAAGLPADYRRDALRSFPSGHTTAAGITYTLLAVPYVFKTFSDKSGKIICLLASVLYTGMVAFGRVLMGAHYFSDVLVGGSVTFFVSFFAVWLVYEKKAVRPLTKFCGGE